MTLTLTTPRFTFFDKEVVKDPAGQVFEKLKDLDINASTAGRGLLTLGDDQGYVIQLDKTLSVTGFAAHTKSITHMQQLRTLNILVTVGYDEDNLCPQLKIWHMDKLDIDNRPHCSRIVSLKPNKDSGNAQVTALYVHENGSAMAVGFGDGNVMYFKGDIAKDRLCKLTVLSDMSDEITGLGIRYSTKSQILYVTSQFDLLAYDITNKEKIERTIKESYGARSRCTAMSDDCLEHQFLVGRNDGVYYIHPEGRGATAPLEGEKYQIYWNRGYVVTVGKSNINREMDIVTIYDTQNRFIAYTGPIPQVSNVLFEWGSIYVLAADNKFFALREKPTQTKLDLLFKKNQYLTALNIAKSQRYDDQGIVDIFRLYGDYLYNEKTDYDGAVEQYKKTIGKLEPSYVIRRFLDAQRIHNLTSYLEELHNKQCATDDHTTLLLNCYSKRKDADKLDDFIQKREVNFDVDTAIKVLRQSDYNRHALLLAERHEKHEWYMKIQLENIKDFQAALKYMQNLNFTEAEENMKKYGRILVNALPRETTDILTKLCLGKFKTNCFSPPDEFVHIFVNNSDQLIDFLEAVTSAKAELPCVIYNTLLELYLHKWASIVDHGTKPTREQMQVKAEFEEKIMKLLEQSELYNIDQALVLCQLNKFKPGILHLYQQGKLYQQIVRFYMDSNDYPNVIKACKEWGHLETHLWVMALTYFAKKEDNCRPQIKEVLEHIDQQKLLPPLLVVQTLANSSVCTLGIIKDFIVNRLQKENSQIEEDEKLIQKYTDEAKQLRIKIDKLQHEPQVFQVSTCTVCSHRLELPSIHFLCQHSYHQHCFESYAENETECPACVNDNREIIEKLYLQESENDSDLSVTFQDKIKSSKDGFNVIAEYFGRGVFKKAPDGSMTTRQTKPVVNQPQIKPTNPRINPFGNQMSEASYSNEYKRPHRPGASTQSVSIPSATPPTVTDRTGSPTLDVINIKPGARQSAPSNTSRTPPSQPVTRAKAQDIIQQPPPRKQNSQIESTSPSKLSADQGHTRQRSAGRMIESGLSFIKGHMRNPSDQSKQTTARNQPIERPDKHQRQKSDEHVKRVSSAPRGLDDVSRSSRPSTSPGPNPFEETPPKPFDQPPARSTKALFEEENGPQSNPFLEGKTSLNPFESSLDSGGTAALAKPFEQLPNKNPFEEDDEGRNPFL